MPGDEDFEKVKEDQGLVPEDHEEEGHDADEWLGEDDWGEEKEDEAVAVAEPEVPEYVDNGDETISDPLHHIMWKKADSFKDFSYGITWTEALDYCESMNEKKFAGYTDWRLPGYEEAKTLFSYSKCNVDKSGAELHIDPIFEPGGGHNTWTYEEKPDYQQYAMKFSYVTGNEVWEHKDNEYSHARLVRDEQKEEWEPKWRQASKKFEG
ncbi:MAG: hypothetical protein A3K09_08405 [Nitrospinae bacterium RIFCSPLOWO2_12_FULL_47_7]|nr:MAG: hypothetical protein A3K09_08405 [Nitrospinae bacterium RIFCSPLOWO2_12_FULL_47_7]